MALTLDTEFTLGEFHILPRQNRIMYANETIKLEPKVMAVLCYLAQNHEKVVSVDELILHVWQGTIVSNQSAQRCISILRKVFKTEQNAEPYIANYSKKGYQLLHPPILKNDTTQVEKGLYPSDSETRDSETRDTLISDVIISNAPAQINTLSKPRLVNIKMIIGTCLAIMTVVAFISQFIISLQQNSPLLFNKITPLTSADGYEYYAEPNPNGSHIAYVKKKQFVYQLVIVNAQREEWIITESEHPWNHLNWSPDGRSLAISKANNQETELSIFEFDFVTQLSKHKAHNLPFSPYDLSSITWQNEHLLLLAAKKQSHSYQLFQFDISQNTLAALPNTENVKFVQQKGNILARAIIDTHNTTIQIVNVTDPSSEVINYEWQIDSHITDLSWHPNNEHLLLLTNNKMSLYSLKGEEQTIHYLTENSLHRPRFSTDASKIYITQEKENYDIWRINPPNKDEQLTRSTYTDRNGIFTHKGNSFVFVSNRSGSDQIWQNTQGSEQQLSHYEDDRKIENINWAQGQDHLLVKFSSHSSLFSLLTQSETLLENSPNHYPISFSAERNTLTYIKIENDIKSLWQRPLGNTLTDKKIIDNLVWAWGQGGKTYFQKQDEQGVWQINLDNIEAVKINEDIPKNSTLFSFDDQGIYYSPEDSAQAQWFYVNFNLQKHSIYLQAPQIKGWISSIHPHYGALSNQNSIKEKNIISLENTH
ncbi:winged helix-turn-helix domain-containing protein [Algibacillus agarilyticus]|uniref:winged helix-turn-helix domain-containing protein n=1 Tax=Algibacillus agarilyticus TaxID=2234133 RepID=UPI000DD09607|nr:winged helix-turn-helix domain-containing protein [Algibacillus agarilyticus]